jgi:hypothetical protein
VLFVYAFAIDRFLKQGNDQAVASLIEAARQPH